MAAPQSTGAAGHRKGTHADREEADLAAIQKRPCSSPFYRRGAEYPRICPDRISKPTKEINRRVWNPGGHEAQITRVLCKSQWGDVRVS